MRRRSYQLIVLSVLVAAALACGAAGTPAPSVAGRATSLAKTASALLTSTAAAQFTAASPTPLPSATAQPTSAPTATAPLVPATPDTPTPSLSPTPCENDSEFVSDVSVPDGTHFAAGTVFVKTWRLRNNGACTWTTAYSLRHVSGDGMSGAAITLPSEVPAGASVDLSVTLTAPSGNGTFTGQWQLHNPAGVAFGTKPFVQIAVP